MKKIVLIIAFWFIQGLVLAQTVEHPAAFAIYLTQDRWNETSKAQLSELKLLNEPIITDADILQYRWSTHEIILSGLGAKKFRRLIGRSEAGQGFVIVADGKRCYQGAFWLEIWSASNPGPVIQIKLEDPFDPNAPQNRIKIDRSYPDSAEFTKGEDPRNDKRIFEALNRTGKLIDSNQKKEKK